jgi:hypothetical protein
MVYLARGFKKVGRHSEYSIYTVWRRIGRAQAGGSSDPPEPRICFSLLRTSWFAACAAACADPSSAHAPQARAGPPAEPEPEIHRVDLESGSTLRRL